MRSPRPTPTPALNEALQVMLVDGEVVLIGPGRAGFSMTLSAARDTGARIADVLAAHGGPKRPI